MEDKKRTKQLTWFIISIAVVAVVFFVYQSRPTAPAGFLDTKVAQAELDTFATCIADSGAKMYGAFWCSHCQNQKEAFGGSLSLPYVECSTSDGKGQTAECAAAGIKGYPTWKFPDGVEKSGELDFSEIARYTGCTAP